LLKQLLRIVRHLDGDRLHALRKRAKRFHRCIHIVLTELLHILDIADHVSASPGAVADTCHFPLMVLAFSPARREYIALHKKVKPCFAVQYRPRGEACLTVSQAA
jgi:hypothetical protein